jgi:serine/threonine protein kinase
MNSGSKLTSSHSRLGYTHEYHESECIIFRDLKPENVLIDDDGWPVIIDCGFAKHCQTTTYTFLGTPQYLAPEIVTNKGHGKAVDHWALGIVTYEMITGENPFYFEEMDQMALFQAIVQEPFFPLTEEYSPALEDFLSGLLQKDPIHRLGSLSGRERDILRHEWFNDLDIDKLRNKEVEAPYVPNISK